MFFHKSNWSRGLLASGLGLALLSARARALTPWSLAINTNNLVVVTNVLFGASTTNADNAAAIQSAINAAAAGGLVGGLRGGMVEIPPGTFLCGPLTLKSNVRLQLDAGSVIQLLPRGTWPGSPYTGTVAPLLNGSGLTNLAVTGAGLFDGQGSPWWPDYKTINRPLILNFSPCSKVLLQDFTSSNPPVAHIAIKGANAGNISIIGVKLFAPDSSDPVNPSHNTDGVDFAETNALFQDCVISTGDDNIAIGSSGSVSKDMLVTNCFFGFGHGLSIGSYTSGGVSNLTAINCTFSKTGNGIKIKSSRDRGGVVQNCKYLNLTMTNVANAIMVYAYYEYGLGTLETMNAAFAANVAYTTTNPVPYDPPVYRNLTISNVTASVPAGQPPLMIWGLPDHPVSNLVLQSVQLFSSSTTPSEIYNTTNLQCIDCLFSAPARIKTHWLWNADLTFSNSLPATNLVILDGLTTNGVGNTLQFYNAPATVANTNAIASGALTLASGTLTISNNFTETTAVPLNFTCGTNPVALAVAGNLALGGMVNVLAGPGFTNGTYPLMTYSGSLSGGLPLLGAAPSGYVCALSSATANQINLVVTPPPPGIPANLTATGSNLVINLSWFAATNADGYDLKRSTTSGGPYSLLNNVTGTNYSDSAAQPGLTYYYVVAATNSSMESPDSIPASAISLPSSVSPNVSLQTVGGQLQLSWPPDHRGWRLEIQTNIPGQGISTNWVTWADSTNLTAAVFSMTPTNGAVFLRLVYP